MGYDTATSTGTGPPVHTPRRGTDVWAAGGVHTPPELQRFHHNQRQPGGEGHQQRQLDRSLSPTIQRPNLVHPHVPPLALRGSRRSLSSASTWVKAGHSVPRRGEAGEMPNPSGLRAQAEMHSAFASMLRGGAAGEGGVPVSRDTPRVTPSRPLSASNSPRTNIPAAISPRD